MELKVTGLGPEPFYVEGPNGEASGMDLDIVRLMVEKTGAHLKFEPAVDWFNVAVDEAGNQYYIGCIPNIIYQRSTFAISCIVFTSATFAWDFIDFLFHTYIDYHYVTAKPQVSFFTLPFNVS